MPWFDGPVSLFPWALIFIGLCFVGAAILALIGIKLWHSVKALGRDTTSLGSSLARLSGAAAPYDPNE